MTPISRMRLCGSHRGSMGYSPAPWYAVVASTPPVYLRTVSIQNVRTLETFEWKVSGKDNYAGWHVIIGDNGAGKTSVLRSIALALTGPTEAIALRQDWSRWLRTNEQEGRITVSIDPDSKFDKFAGKGSKVTRYYLNCGIVLTRTPQGVTAGAAEQKRDPNRHIWSGKRAWFSAAYGPFRRFSGGDKDAEKLFQSKAGPAPFYLRREHRSIRKLSVAPEFAIQEVGSNASECPRS